jgi:hypothetical protein
VLENAEVKGHVFCMLKPLQKIPQIDLKEMGINRRNLVDLAEDRDYWSALVNAALNFRVP